MHADKLLCSVNKTAHTCLVSLTAVKIMTRISYEKLQIFMVRCFVVLILKCMLNLKEAKEAITFVRSRVNFI